MKAPLSEEYFLQIGQTSDLTKILSLNLSNHGLQSIDPTLFNKLTRLETLDISQNKLTEIPSTLHLPNLRVLDVSDNNLQSVDFVKQFSKMHELYLEDNDEISMDDYYKAKVLCPTLKSIDGSGEVKHIETGVNMYISQLQPQIEAVWEAKFSEVYSSGISIEEIDQLHQEFVTVIEKAGIIGANLTMPHFRQFMIDHLCKKLLISVNRGSFKIARRVKMTATQEGSASTTPSKYGTRISKGATPLKNYSTGAPVNADDVEMKSPSRASTPRQSTKRKREGTPSESPAAKRQRQGDAKPLVAKLKLNSDTPQKQLPVSADYDPSLFLRCHSKDNNPGDGNTKVWKCAFEPSLEKEGETTSILATCGGKLVCLVDCQTGRVLRRYKDSSKSESFYTLAWTTLEADDETLLDDVNILAVAGEDGIIKLIHPTQLLMFGSLEGHKGYISSLVFHPTRPNILFSGSRDNRIIMWDIGTPDFQNSKINWKKLHTLNLPKTDALSLVVDPDLDLLVAGCERSCYAWHIPTVDREWSSSNVPPHYEFVHPVEDPDEEATVDGLALLPNGCIASKCVGDDILYVWDLEASTGKKRLSGSRVHRVQVEPLAMLQYAKIDVDYLYPHSSGGMLCVGDDKGRVFLYDVSHIIKHKSRRSDEIMLASNILEFPEMVVDKKFDSKITDLGSCKEGCVVNCVTMTSDRKYLAYGTDNNLVCIWKKAAV